METILLFLFMTFLACNLVIANEWAKSGLFELSLQLTKNKRVLTSLLVIFLVIVTTELLEKRGSISKDMYYNNIILLIIPAIWFIIVRTITPKGRLEFNRAIIRTIYWSRSFYVPGKQLRERGDFLNKIKSAKDTIRLYKRSITSSYVENYDFNLIKIQQCNMVTAYEEMGFLYRMMNQFAKAHKSYSISRSLIEPLLVDDHENHHYLKLKSLVLFRQAEAYQAEGIEKKTAIELYGESLQIDNQIGVLNDSELTKKLLLTI